MPQLIELLEHHIQGLDDVAACTVAIRSALVVGDLDRLGTVLEGLEAATDEADRRDTEHGVYLAGRGLSLDMVPELDDPDAGPRARRAVSARRERLRMVHAGAAATRVLAAETVHHLGSIGGAAPPRTAETTGHRFLVPEVVS